MDDSTPVDDSTPIASAHRRRRQPTELLLERRQEAAALAESRPLADGVTLTETTARGVRVGVFDVPEPHAAGTVFYLHGGGFRQGTVRTYATFTSHLAALIGARLVSVDYRLAPEEPFPAGLEDAVAAYAWLVEELAPAADVVVAGDSAGGGLAASLLLEIRRLGLRPPLAAALVSPWADLRNIAGSFTANAETDPVFPHSSAVEAADMYLADWDAADPLVSPVLGEWSGQPPMLVIASQIESLRDDALLLADIGRAAGVPVELDLFDDTAHGWWMEYPSTAASREVVAEIGRFVTGALRGAEIIRRDGDASSAKTPESADLDG